MMTVMLVMILLSGVTLALPNYNPPACCIRALYRYISPIFLVFP